MLRQTNQRPLLAYFDAIKNLRLRQLSLILKAGYDPNLMLNVRGQNGLQFMVQYFGASEAHMLRLEIPTARSAYLNIAKLLLDAGLDPNATDLLTGESVIFDAIKLNDRELVAILLHYVDLSLRNKDGETALMCASRFGSKQLLRLILSHLHELELDEFYLRQRNRFGLTALDLARAENLDCAKLLAKHLIALGHPTTNSFLTRSSSHHQLNFVARQALLRRPLAAGPTSRSYAPDDGLMLSDCDSVVDFAGLPSGRRPSRIFGANGRGLGSYDQRAIEFNQYLMNRSEAKQHHQQQQYNQLTTSTDEDEEIHSDVGFSANPNPYGMSNSSSLMRSRSSCNLAGPTGSSMNEYENNKQKVGDGNPMKVNDGKYARASGQNAGSSCSKSKLSK